MTDEKKNKLSLYMEKYCVSNSQFAQKIGVTHTTFMKYLRGINLPSIPIARIIEKETEGKVKISDW